MLAITSTGTATADAGSASADATIYAGVGGIAYAHGADNTADVTLTNDGELDVAALAVANATTEANANAGIQFGVFQSAIGYDGLGSVAIVNGADASLDVSATARIDDAVSTATEAYADASMYIGIEQFAGASQPDSNSAQASIDNSGSISIGSNASALAADDAEANAGINWGIYQWASGTEAASASISNATGASIDIAAVANATALDGAALAHLHRHGYLMAAHQMGASLVQMRELIERKNQRVAVDG